MLTNKNIGEYSTWSLKITFEKEKNLSVTFIFFHPDYVVRLLKSLSYLSFPFFFFPLLLSLLKN